MANEDQLLTEIEAVAKTLREPVPAGDPHFDLEHPGAPLVSVLGGNAEGHLRVALVHITEAVGWRRRLAPTEAAAEPQDEPESPEGAQEASEGAEPEQEAEAAQAKPAPRRRGGPGRGKG